MARIRITRETKPWKQMTPEEKATAFDQSVAAPTDYARANFTDRTEPVAGEGESPFWGRGRHRKAD